MKEAKLKWWDKKSLEKVQFARQVIKRYETYHFQKFKTREIYIGIITLNNGLEEQMNLKDEIDKFNDSTRPKKKKKRKKKK